MATNQANLACEKATSKRELEKRQHRGKLRIDVTRNWKQVVRHLTVATLRLTIIRMIYLNLWITVTLPEDVPAIAGLLARCITLSRQETGCVKYEVYHSQRDRQRFLIIEHWTSQEDWDRHRTGRAFLEIYQPEIMPRVTREPHVCDQLAPA